MFSQLSKLRQVNVTASSLASRPTSQVSEPTFSIFLALPFYSESSQGLFLGTSMASLEPLSASKFAVMEMKRVK